MKSHVELVCRPSHIIEMIDLYQEWRHRMRNTRKPYKVFSKKTLHYICERLFWSEFGDSKYVATFLHCLWEEDHLFSIFVPQVGNCPSLIHIKPHMLLTYFLRHAYTEKLIMFDSRLPCVQIYHSSIGWQFPVYLAFSWLDHQLLCEMVRYGGMFEFAAEHFNYSLDGTYIPKSIHILMLTIRASTLLDSSLLYMRDFNPDHHKMTKFKKLLVCCKLILTDIPNYRRTSTSVLRMLKERFSFVETFRNNVYPHIREDLHAPMTLKSSCRQVIRKTLNAKFLLPHGIYQLPLPHILQRFLDIIL